MIIIQARMASTRLPGKVLRDLGGRRVLSWVVRAAQESGIGEPVVVATSRNAADDQVVSLAQECGAKITRGPQEDVLSRFMLAVEEHGPARAVVRLTADNPLLDPELIAGAWAAFQRIGVAYLSTMLPRSLPRGLDVEVADVRSLQQANDEATGADRAHVTSYLYREPGRFNTAGLAFQPRSDDLRVTLDTPEDAEALEALVTELGDRPPAWQEVVRLLRRRPDIVALNAHVRQKSLDEG